MNIFLIAIILGVVEGITEFLPISSTGHLIIAGHYLEFTGNLATTFSISIQLGSILAVVYYFKDKIFSLLGNFKNDKVSREFIFTVCLAFVPSAIVGLLIHGWVEENLFNPITVACALIVGGVLIIIIENKAYHPEITQLENIGYKKGLLVGCAQCLALFPGMSRSASTIMGALILGFNRVTAAEFSFFLAIPTMFAATGYDLFKNRNILSTDDFLVILTGLVVAFISSLMVIKFLFAFIKKYDFKPFAYYRIVLGFLILGFWS
ncbi:MAG: undecaprenyl-diphosphate phosphatase [Nitrospinae bacterium]|nr:undecaprenyl-diphosphate phosphatase [Nitrospinota bacterium]